jgi:hypothetical protein
MECLHLPTGEPGKGGPTLPSIPLVAEQRWDGGPFLEYPQRRGFQAMYDGAGGTTDYPWERSPAAQQLSTKELEAFFQEWLFFGLITEALDGNSGTLGSSPLPPAQQTNDKPTQEHNNAASRECHTHGHSQTTVDRVYRDFVYQADAKSYITTRTFTSELRSSWSISCLSFYPTRNHLAVRCKRMCLCLRQAHYFYTHFPADFGSDIKFSIGAIAETIAHAMQLVCHYLDLEEICPNQWGDGYYADKKVKSRMVKRGWCPTDLARSTHTFKFLQTLHYLSYLDKKMPAKDHAECSLSECVPDRITATSGIRDHWMERCSCEKVTVDHEDVMGALTTNEAIPLLLLKEGEPATKTTDGATNAKSKGRDLTIEVVRSTGSTPYIAISHVSLSHVSLSPCEKNTMLTSIDLGRWTREQGSKFAQCLQAS